MEQPFVTARAAKVEGQEAETPSKPVVKVWERTVVGLPLSLIILIVILGIIGLMLTLRRQ